MADPRQGWPVWALWVGALAAAFAPWAAFLVRETRILHVDGGAMFTLAPLRVTSVTISFTITSRVRIPSGRNRYDSTIGTMNFPPPVHTSYPRPLRYRLPYRIIAASGGTFL